MTITFRPSAYKQLERLPPSAQKKVFNKITLFADEPLPGKELKGEFKDLRSYRAWPYRIVYKIVSKRIIIFSVAHRQGIKLFRF